MSSTYTLTADNGTFSGLTNITDDLKPQDRAPLIVALHGGTYTSGYFDIPGFSLLDRAADQGLPVIALDRPNYVDSPSLETDESIILANADMLRDTIGSLWAQHQSDSPGIVLIAHSIGAAVATAIAASAPSWPLLGLATSGCLVRVPQESREAWEALPPVSMIDLPVPMKDQVMFGPADTYSDDMPAASHPANSLVPKAELLDITGGWIDRRAEMCARILVPVHHRQGEFDALWITDQDELDQYQAGFTAAPSADIAVQPGSGHCIDFHRASAEFQSSQLAFARDCAARSVQ